MNEAPRHKVPGHVKAAVIQYLMRVAQLTSDQIMEATDIDAEEVLMAMEEPISFKIPIEDRELIRQVQAILPRFGIT